MSHALLSIPESRTVGVEGIPTYFGLGVENIVGDVTFNQDKQELVI